MNSRTIALLAIVCGLVVLCLGMWYIWNTQQLFRSEMQYVRDQCDQLQKQLFIPRATYVQPIDATTELDNDTCEIDTSTTYINPGESSVVDDIAHRSCVIQEASVSVQSPDINIVEEDSELSEEDTSEDDDNDDEYNDDDQVVKKEDLVDGNEITNPVNHNVASEENTNELVHSLLSNIVSESVNSMTEPLESALTSVPVQDATESVEDFMETKSDYAILADTLRKKTVVELKKMCQEHQIGIKNGKSFKRKEELIDELVEKLPQ